MATTKASKKSTRPTTRKRLSERVNRRFVEDRPFFFRAIFSLAVIVVMSLFLFIDPCDLACYQHGQIKGLGSTCGYWRCGHRHGVCNGILVANRWHDRIQSVVLVDWCKRMDRRFCDVAAATRFECVATVSDRCHDGCKPRG